MTLTDFLLGRIAEDEERARDAYYDGQVWAPEEESVVSLDRDLDVVTTLDRKRDAWFAADWSPSRVLAECQAKRRIVTVSAVGAAKDTDDWACVAWAVLCDLATVYADHPDYEESWRP